MSKQGQRHEKIREGNAGEGMPIDAGIFDQVEGDLT